jgi:GNAT superfamily N-acetyltransferase
MTESSELVTAELRAAYDEQMRIGIPQDPPAGYHYERFGQLLRLTGRHRGFISTARDIGVRGAELDRLIAEHRDHFAARGEAVEWKTRDHDLPADLPQRLREAGFTPEDREAVMIGTTAELGAEPGAEPVLPDGVTIRQVEAEADLRRIADMESEVWGEEMGWLGDDLIGRVAAAPEQVCVLAAEAEGTVVSAAWLVIRPGSEFGGLWGGSTLAAWRKRGIYRALLARRAGIAADRGIRYLQVDASDDSAPILRRLGFHEVTVTTPYVWSPPTA